MHDSAYSAFRWCQLLGCCFWSPCLLWRSFFINGNAIFTLSRKQSTTANNRTEAELNAATTLSKHVLWIRIYMEDMSLPYHAPVPLPKLLTCNACHIATKTKALQEHVCHAHVSFHRVSSTCNLAENNPFVREPLSTYRLITLVSIPVLRSQRTLTGEAKDTKSGVMFLLQCIL